MKKRLKFRKEYVNASMEYWNRTIFIILIQNKHNICEPREL